MNKGSVVFAFISGVGIGAGITWLYAKKKYEEIIDKEVSSARETYNQLGKELIEKNNKLKDKMFENLNNNFTDSTVKEYIETIDENGYSSEEEIVEETEEQIEEVKVVDVPKIKTSTNPYAPYEITESEYGSDDSYNLVSLTYYSDGYLMDDLDEFVDDPEEILGADIFTLLEQYEQQQVDSVYFRNDTRRSDYQILLTGYNFSE